MAPIHSYSAEITSRGEIVKTIIVIAIAAASAAVGESFLSYGMRTYGEINLTNPSHWLALIMSLVKNPSIFAGVFFLAIFFFLYLAALSWADLSFVLPLTALSYLFAAFLAKYFLKEDVSWYRWIGTVVIVIGIAIVAFDTTIRTSDHCSRKYPAVQNIQEASQANDKTNN
jgi:drug/metabolite transporter (DMT)-like permease